MIQSLVRSITLLISKPALALPALIAGAFQLALFGILANFVYELVDDLVFLGMSPNGSFDSLPFQLYSIYSIHINIVILLFFASIFTGVWSLFVYAKYANDSAKKQASIVKSIGFGLKNFGKILTISLAVSLFLLFIAAISWLALVVVARIGLIGTILVLSLGLFLVYLWIKLYFSITITAVEEIPLKEGIKKSWNFSQKRFFGIILFILLVSIIGSIISGIGFAIADLMPEDLDIAYFAIVIIFFALSSAYSNIAAIVYFMKKEYSKLP